MESLKKKGINRDIGQSNYLLYRKKLKSKRKWGKLNLKII